MQKTIFITGASSGIGKIIGEYLVDQGHIVIGTSRRTDASNEAFEMIQLDVSSDESAVKAVQICLEKYKQIDVLINCAGYGISGPLENTSIQEAREQFETNYFGLVRMTNLFLPHFKERGKGLIINISSLGGIMGLPFQGHYSASKFALEGYTEALRIELLPFGVEVCNVNPADFQSSFSANRKISEFVGPEYKPAFDQFLGMYEEDEHHGADPILIGKLIQRIIHTKQVKVRYLVGKRNQTIGAFLKRLLGSNLFEKMMKKIWGV